MKESRLNVKVLDIPVKDCSHVHERAEGLETGRRGGRLVVVNEITLRKAFGDISHFVSGDIARIIPFAFANQFPFKGSLATRNFGAGYQNEDSQVLETFEFIARSCDPVFTLRRGDGGGPKRVIVRVKGDLGGPIGQCRECFTDS